MAFKIGGFAAEYHEKKQQEQPQPVQQVAAPKKSVVKVYFIGSGKKLSYYNDQFDLHNGDMVYVEGSMEGQRGRVIEVSYNFKIKLSDYKRVVAVIDTNVHGQFFMAGSHFVAFDPVALPALKAECGSCLLQRRTKKLFAAAMAVPSNWRICPACRSLMQLQSAGMITTWRIGSDTFASMIPRAMPL